LKKTIDLPHFGEQSEMHRPAQPEEISPSYVFLVAPSCSSYFTGTASRASAIRR
jgi:hypothetical protein